MNRTTKPVTLALIGNRIELQDCFVKICLAFLMILAVFAWKSEQAAAASKTENNDATWATKAANARVLQIHPFSNKQDFKNAHKGFIAPLPGQEIKTKAGNPVWSPNKFAFIKEDSVAPDTVNPSLWRNAQLISISGLFKVTEGIYQTHNHDLPNMTIIEGDRGIVVVDPMISAETAGIGMDVYYKNRGKKSVIEVIYTHSHIDHYGGLCGVIDQAELNRRGKS